MLINDTKRDFKIYLMDNKLTQQKVADICGKPRSYIAVVPLGKVMKDGFIEMWEKLGYDIKIEYVKREE